MNFRKIRPVEEQVKTNLIVKVLAGSHAYGTNIISSDTDYRGIFHADPIHYLTPFYPLEQFQDPAEEDSTYFEINKYLQLYLDANPNILEILWVEQSDIIERSETYDLMREYAKPLLSSKVAFTFTGYAASQLKRIRGHEKWISNPKTIDPPKQVDYISLVHNFTDQKIFKINLRDYRDNYRLIPYDGNLYGLYQIDGYQTYDDTFNLNTLYEVSEDQFLERNHRRIPKMIVKFHKEQYDQDNMDWKNYWTWKKNRNVARSALEEQFGFDTKHAMHLVRLMRMGAEILEGKGVLVKRPDAQELLEIRNGSMTYEELIKYSSEMDDYIRNDLYHRTKLTKKPNVELAAELLLKIKKNFN